MTARFVFILSICLSSCASLFATDSEIISYISHWQLEEGKAICYDSIVIQINNSRGENAARISLPYSKNEKLNIGDVWIEDRQGNIVRKLKKNDWEEHSAFSTSTFYSDYYVKTAQLKHNEYPYRIVYSFRTTTTDFLGIGWSPVIFANQDIQSARLTIHIPAENYPVRFKNENIADPEILTVGKLKQYTWQTAYRSKKAEKFAPSSELQIPSVYFIPVFFKYGVKGSWESWNTVGNWISKLNEKTTILPEDEKQKVNQLVVGASTPLEKAKILYAYLQQQTRYINVSLKTGGLKSYPAEYVAKNKYGDCKALSTYMIALLEQVGIPAYYTLIQAGEAIKPIDKDFPHQAFNHVIVTLPLDNDTLFLECTSKNIPFGYLGTFTQGREALVIQKNQSFFVRTPALESQDVACSSYITANNPSTKIDCTMHLRGAAFDELKFFFANTHRDELEKAVRWFIPAGNYDVQSLAIQQEPDKPVIAIQAALQISSVTKNYGNHIALSPFPIALPGIEPPQERKQGIALYYPIAQSDTIAYNFPYQTIATVKPEDIDIRSPYGVYSVQYNITEHQLLVIKNLLIFQGFYPVSEYAAFYEFWSAVRANENKNYYIETQ